MLVPFLLYYANHFTRVQTHTTPRGVQRVGFGGPIAGVPPDFFVFFAREAHTIFLGKFLSELTIISIIERTDDKVIGTLVINHAAGVTELVIM